MNNAEGRPEGPVYRFRDCELDRARRELWRGGALVSLQPKVFELLAYLIEHRDRAVDKNEIQDAIWPRVVVTETSLTQAIRKARRAVGDDSDTQAVIRTIHGHGYRFVAELISPTAAVDLTSPAGLPESAPEPAAETPSTPEAVPEPLVISDAARVARARWNPLQTRALWLAAALSAVILAAALWLVRPGALEASAVRVAVLPLDNATRELEFDWTRLGLMSVASSQIAAAELPVVADADILRLTSSKEARAENGAEWLRETLRHAYGATHVLTTRLERQAGLLRLTYSLSGPEGGSHAGTMVGDDPMVLARAVGQSVLEQLGTPSRRGEPQHLVSDDPFVNEAYARGRGMSLEGRCEDAQALFMAAINQAPDLFEPRFEYAVCSRVLGAWQEAETALEALVLEHDKTAPSRPHIRALNELGVVFNRTGRLDEADASYERGLAEARAIGDLELEGQLLTNLSIVAEDRGDFDKARDYLGRAIHAYGQSGREIVPGQVPAGLANIAMDEGDLDEADRQLALALDTFRAIGDRRNEAMMLNNLGYLRRLQGRLEDAEALHRASGEIRSELGDRVGLGRVQNMLALLYNDQGRFDQAIEAANSALDILGPARDRLYEATAYSHLGDATLGLGRLDEAEAHYRQALSIYVEIKDRMRAMYVPLRLARIELERSRLDSAGRSAEEILASAREHRYAEVEIEALELLGDIAAARGDVAEHIAHYEQALERARAIGHEGRQIAVSIELAGSHLDAGNIEAAEPLLGMLANRPESARLLDLRARYAYLQGNKQAAVKMMERSRKLAGQRWSPENEERLALYRQ